MEKTGSLSGMDSSRPADSSSARAESIKRCIESLQHACECAVANCHLPKCHHMKKVVQHTNLCRKRSKMDCPVCVQLIALCCYHVDSCELSECPVPFCSNFRQTLQARKLALGLLREKCEAAQAMCGHAGMPWTCMACCEVCHS